MIGFADFLRHVREDGRGPYSWQVRLAERCAAGEPPDVIAVPTGAGKTTTVHALVWALARQAELAAADRTVGVRIVWAIDRRILVDEVHTQAQRLAELLGAAVEEPRDPLHDMASRLAGLSGGPPLVATRWRGGLDARTERHGPLQPQIITSTVAQIGSRLLFRGYGVARGSLALEAGQAACDATICLDEAHLAEPFRQTVDAIRAHRASGERTVALPGLRLVTLTATPPQDDRRLDVLRLDDTDRAQLGPRITGQKTATLAEPPAGGGEAGAVMLIVETAAAYVRDGKPTVACVVNTVRRARAVFDALAKELGDAADVTLLIGPQRPADRDLVLARHRAALFDGTPSEKPVVCVATQTFEVGLDADVAAMVTESASASALVQRLGRLNRRGQASGRATIVRDEGRWLYEDDEPAAWEWLRGLEREDGTIDVSVGALERAAPPPARCIPSAASLTPDIVTLLAHTAPAPAQWADPDPDVFVRGVAAEPAADVAICWRSDLRPGLGTPEVDGYRTMLLELAPPDPRELLTLSLTSARALLAARYARHGTSPAAAARLAVFDADVEDAMLEAPVPEPDPGDGDNVPFLVLRRGDVRRGTLARTRRNTEDDADAPIAVGRLAPGDVIVLPTRAGGADELGLAPLQPRTESATDVAPDRRPVGKPVPVRITPEALGAATGAPLSPPTWAKVAQACRDAERRILRVRGGAARQAEVDVLVAALAELLPEHPALPLLLAGRSERGASGVVLRAVGKVDPGGMPVLDRAEEEGDDEGDEAASVGEEPASDATPEPEMPSDVVPALERVWVLVPVPAGRRERHDRLVGDEVPPPTLAAHASAVCAEVTAVAERLQLDPATTGALALAARAHDHGKADPREQAFYRRGVDAFGAVPIAKSEFGTSDPRMAGIAARLAGLPRQLRHERGSVTILADAIASGRVEVDGLDLDLVLHLPGTHHGYARPWPLLPEGGRAPRPFHVDAAGVAGSARGDASDGWEEGAWIERFGRVVERYGAWGVAYLESLLMLSDRAVSARGE